MKKLIAFVFLLLPVVSFGQRKQGKALLDSLVKELKVANTEDSNKAKILLGLSNGYYFYSTETGINYGQKALTVAENINWQIGVARSYMAIGVNYEGVSNFPMALSYYYKALKTYEHEGNKKGIANSCWGIGNILNGQKNYNKSLEYDYKVLKVYEELNDKRGISSLYGNIANNLLELGKYDEALAYYLKALPMKEELGDPNTIAIQLLNVGNAYFKKSNYSLALVYYYKAQRVVPKEDAKTTYARNLANIGAAYVKLATDSLYTIKPDSLILEGKTANLDKGIGYLKESLVYSKEIDDMEAMLNTYSDLAEAQEYKGEYKDALHNYKEHVRFKDSIFSQENSLKILELDNQRDLDLKDKDIKIERLKSTIFIISIGLLLIIVLVIVMKFRQQVRSNRTLAHEKEKHLEHIQAQGNTLKDIAYIQSHYVRGPVTTILGLSQLFNMDNPEDSHNKELMAGIVSVAIKLDHTVTNVVNKENSLKKDSSVI